jgi:hypothetical protein
MRLCPGALSVGLLATVVLAAPARADLVYLTNGRSWSVKAHRQEGPQVVLSLRSGGELSCDASLVDRIEPDEVPWPEPVPESPAVEAAAPTAGSAAAPYTDLIEPLARRHGVDAGLVHAVVATESNYAAQARSRKGAMGLMQLMPATARQYAVADPYDPKSNLEAGIRHLKSLLERFDVPLALAAYNAGEATVRRYGGIPPYRETRSYVSRILSRWQAPSLGLP